MMTSATVYPSLTHGQDDIPKGWHWSARYVLPKPLIWRRPSSDPSKLGEEIAFFFFFSPSDRSWMIATICHGIAINQGYHGNTYQPAMQWMGILMRWSTRCFTAVRFHRVPAQVFSLKPVEPLFSSGIPIKKNTWTCIAASNLLHKTNVRLQWDEWWFGTFFIFPFSWECHHPNWRTHIFFRGVGIPPKRGYFLLSRLMGFTTIVIYSHQQPLACTPRVRWMEYPQSWLLIGAKLRFLVSAPGMPGQRHRALGHEESDGYRGVERCNETPRMVILVN